MRRDHFPRQSVWGILCVNYPPEAKVEVLSIFKTGKVIWIRQWYRYSCFSHMQNACGCQRDTGQDKDLCCIALFAWIRELTPVSSTKSPIISASEVIISPIKTNNRETKMCCRWFKMTVTFCPWGWYLLVVREWS